MQHIRESKDGINKWGNIQCLLIERLNFKMSSLLEFIYGFNAVPNKIPANTDIEVNETEW